MTILFSVVGIGTTTKRWSNFLMSELVIASVLVLLLSTHCLAQLTCHPMLAPLGVGGELIVPALVDCRRVLTHIPSIAPNSLYYPNTPTLKAFPFLPPSSIHHGTCQFGVNWQLVSLPHGLPHQRPAPVVPMDRVMARIRDGVESIVTQCVEHHQSGTFYGQVDHDDHGATRVFVSNINLEIMQQQQQARIERQRCRIGQTPQGPLLATPDEWIGGDYFHHVLYEV